MDIATTGPPRHPLPVDDRANTAPTPDRARPAAWLHDLMGVSVAALEELRSALPGDVVVTDADAVEKYRYDWSRDPSAGTPVAVVRAGTAEEVQSAVRWAAEHHVPVVPRGAGSGLSGGSSAVDDGIVLSLERMTAIEI